MLHSSYQAFRENGGADCAAVSQKLALEWIGRVLRRPTPEILNVGLKRTMGWVFYDIQSLPGKWA